jgi:hypothetical protein
MLGAVITAPLEVVKTRLQVSCRCELLRGCQVCETLYAALDMTHIAV